MDKSSSDGNLNLVSKNTETTPPNYYFRRAKRDREEDWTSDFSAFKEEMKAMMEALMSDQESELKKLFTPTLTEIQKTNRNIESSIALLMSKNEELTKKVELLEQQKKKDNEYITILENKVEDIQRTERKSSIEVKNVPKGKSETKEDLINMVVRLGKSIDCNINKSEIKDIFRVRGKKEGQINTPIIVEFSSTILKTDVLKMSKAHNIKHKGKLCAKHLGFTRSEDTPVFVSEQLTVKGSRLHYLARDLAKSKGYKFCWTSYGRVYVRKNENSPIITIISENQVNSLIQAI
ncbi:Zinc finger DNA binding protein [Operophtera brumata]|uniref:Zinc finger DNA binding protein n=1 Tax=Operophtera brumata TaxID=104452 RepID=A0A0L7LMX9_OPEBR|nr:Zinc finger DNA binding protein [Operophtera brumata]